MVRLLSSQWSIQWGYYMNASSLSISKVGIAALLVAVVTLTTGCPLFRQEEAGSVKLLLTSGEQFATVKGVASIDVGDLESLTVVVENILLRPTAGSDVGAESVFLGPEAVDFLDLIGLTQLLSSALVMPDEYAELVICVSSAQFSLVSDPGTQIVIDNVFNGGKFVIDGPFTIDEGGNTVLVLDLGGLSLTEDGGVYSFAPVDLTATEEVGFVDVQALGTIEDLTDTTFVLENSGEDTNVDYSTADIYLPGDLGMPSGVPADLSNGAPVAVFGSLDPMGGIDALAVVLLPENGANGIHDVAILSSLYDPPQVIVNLGDTVRWTLLSDPPQTVTSDALASKHAEDDHLFRLVFEQQGDVGTAVPMEDEFGDITFTTELIEAMIQPVKGVEEPEDAVFSYYSEFNSESLQGLIIVRLGDDDGKITICHAPPGNPANAHTIRIGEPALAAHLAHGDTIGACDDQEPVGRERFTVCHNPEGNNPKTLTVSGNALTAHLAHGDTLGECN